jgi:hypothetical protein
MLIGVNTYDSDTPYEAFLGNGDSGGGMFVKVGDQWQLAGINAYDYATFGGYYASSAVNVSTYANWIASNAPVPEPSGLLVLAGATCMLALRRRRLAL